MMVERAADALQSSPCVMGHGDSRNHLQEASRSWKLVAGGMMDDDYNFGFLSFS